MDKMFAAFVIVMLLGISGYFVMQNMQLKKHIREQEDAAEKAGIVPVIPETKPANPQGVSPFEKPNTDPVANEFTPQPDIDTFPATTIKFERMVYDFGRINEGDVVKTQFKFTNAGKTVLLITHAQASCGCTVPTTPKDPIKPGQSNVIDVEFHSAGKKGETIKTVTLDANTRPTKTVLTIKATVIPKDK